MADKYLHDAVNLLPVPNLGTPVILPGRGIVQVVDKKVVGDRGIEPLASTV